MRRLLLLIGLMLVLPTNAHADEEIHARVVSIYRPLEMAARRVSVARKVFIQSTDERAFPDKLVGQTLLVYRVHDVPAQVDMNPNDVPSVSDKASVDVDIDVSTSDKTKLTPLAPLDDGRPAGFSEARNTRTMEQPVYLGSGGGHVDTIKAVKEPPIQTSRIREKVGRIRVLSVEGDVAIASVLEDAIRDAKQKSPSIQPVEGTTISAGDVVEGVLKKKVIKKKVKPLSRAEKNALNRERTRIRRLNKPKKKRGKYKRKIMNWDI